MAMNLIADLIPKLTRDDDKKAFLEGLQRNVALGWTQIHVPGGTFQDISILNENEKKALKVYQKHRSKNLHKMKDIPVFKNDSE